jgi:putative redox protein
VKLGHVTSTGGAEHWRTALQTHGHDIVADEAPPHGADAGPSPFGYLLAGLAACTNITLRMYADRKGWPLTELGVECTFVREGDGDAAVDRIDRVLRFTGDLDDEQRARLADIAERTPVTLVVKRGTEVATTVAP